MSSDAKNKITKLGIGIRNPFRRSSGKNAAGGDVQDDDDDPTTLLSPSSQSGNSSPSPTKPNLPISTSFKNTPPTTNSHSPMPSPKIGSKSVPGSAGSGAVGQGSTPSSSPSPSLGRIAISLSGQRNTSFNSNPNSNAPPSPHSQPSPSSSSGEKNTYPSLFSGQHPPTMNANSNSNSNPAESPRTFVSAVKPSFYPEDERSLLLAKEKLHESLCNMDKEKEETPEEKAKRMRTNVINEIMSSEALYLRNIQTVIKHFKNPMVEQNVLPKQEIANLFSNIDALPRVSEKLIRYLQGLEDLEYADQQVGPVFSSLVKDKDFEVYFKYCIDQNISMETRDKLVDNKQFKEFIERTIQNPDLGSTNTSLDNLLIQPMQRICRYPLLLTELQKRTNTKLDDHELIGTALAQMNTIVDKINSLRTESERKFGLTRIVAKMDNSAPKDIIDDQRSFVSETHFRRAKIFNPSTTLLQSVGLQLLSGSSDKHDSPGELLLFNDLLIIALFNPPPISDTPSTLVPLPLPTIPLGSLSGSVEKTEKIGPPPRLTVLMTIPFHYCRVQDGDSNISLKITHGLDKSLCQVDFFSEDIKTTFKREILYQSGNDEEDSDVRAFTFVCEEEQFDDPDRQNRNLLAGNNTNNALSNPNGIVLENFAPRASISTGGAPFVLFLSPDCGRVVERSATVILPIGLIPQGVSPPTSSSHGSSSAPIPSKPPRKGLPHTASTLAGPAGKTSSSSSVILPGSIVAH